MSDQQEINITNVQVIEDDNSDSISTSIEATNQQSPPSKAEPEVRKAANALADALTVDEKIAAVQDLKITTDSSRQYLGERGLLSDLLPILTVLKVRKDLKALSSLFDLLAELLKFEPNRELASKEEYPLLVSQVFELADHETRYHALRALANLIADNDANRSKVYQAKLFPVLLNELNGDHIPSVCAAAGVLFNFVLSENEMYRDMALDNNVIEIALNKIRSFNDLEALKPVATLVFSFLDSDRGASDFLRCKGLDTIVGFCNHPNQDIQNSAINVLTLLAEEERIRRPLYESGVVDYLFKVTFEHPSIAFKRGAAKTIAVILSNDDNMRSLYDAGKLEIFSNWLRHDDEDIRGYAAASISNISRSDDICKDVCSRDEIVEKLIEMATSKNQKEEHSALNALRNLSILPANRVVLGNKNLIQKLNEILEGDNSPLKFIACITLKNLILNNLTNAETFVETDGPKRIVTTFNNSGHDGLRSEAARTFVNVIRHKNGDLINKLMENDALLLLKELAASPHGILRNEAYQTFLTLQNFVGNDKKLEILKILQDTVPEKGKEDKEEAVNSLVDLLNALLSAEGAKELYNSSKIGDTLRQVTKNLSESVIQKLTALNQTSFS